MRLVPDIAFRLIRSPHKRSFSSLASILAVVGLALGIAALILTFSILQGFEKTLSDKIAGFDGHIRIEHFLNSPLNEHDDMVDSVLADIDLPITTVSYIQKSALIRKGRLAEGLLVEAISVDQLQILEPIISTIPEITTDAWIILGDRLAQSMDIKLDDKIALIDIESMGKPVGQRQLLTFTVIGLFHSGLFEYDKTVAYIGLDRAQELFGMTEKISGTKIITDNIEIIPELVAHLEDGLSYPYYVMTWKEKHHILFQWMATQKLPILIFFGLITLVGVVNILAALSMIVIEKVRAIGILKSMGMTRRSIMTIFTLDGIIIGMLGTILGIVFSLLIAWAQGQWNILTIPEDVYFMDRVPFYFTPMLFVWHMIIGISISMIASIAPAFKAASIEPATAVRYE